MKKPNNNLRSRYSPEFKFEAVRQLLKGDKSPSLLASELGIRRNQLYKWRDRITSYGNEAFPGKGRRSEAAAQDEIALLRAENARLTEENEILKKAAAYFAKQMK